MIPRFSLPALCLLACALAARAADDIHATAPIKRFSLPTFNEAGNRDLLFRADEARILTTHKFDVRNLTLTVFAGDSANTVESVLVSPQATLDVDAGTVTGSDTVRVVHDDVEAEGADWRYLRAEKKIIIDRDAHIVIQAPLQDILQ